MRWHRLLLLVFLVAVFPAMLTANPAQEPAQEPAEPDPAEQSAPSASASEEPVSDQLSIEDMKALSDEDLIHVYREEPWRIPEEYGDDEELLERVMNLAHPELEDEAEATPDPKPDPEPDAG